MLSDTLLLLFTVVFGDVGLLSFSLEGVAVDCCCWLRDFFSYFLRSFPLAEFFSRTSFSPGLKAACAISVVGVIAATRYNNT